MANVSIIGAGSWGTALAFLLHENGHQVTEWSAFEKEAESLRTEHRLKTLPDLVLPDDMEFTSDLERAMKEKDLLVVAVPSIYVRETARKMKPFLKEGQLVVNVAKGIEEATLMTLTDILEEELPGADVTVLSGPSHAEEVSRGLPTTCVAGAKTRKTAEKIQNIFMSPVFRVYISPDILGIEIGGALKNVIALAAGIADGLGITEPVSSPTFTIVQVYEEGRMPFYHFDVYRIGDIEEMDEIGYEDYFYGEGLCMIEWANLIEEILPDKRYDVTIEKDLEKGFDYRKITIKEHEG